MKRTCSCCVAPAGARRAKMRALRRARLKRADMLSTEEEAQARTHFATLLPAGMIEPALVAARAHVRLRERIYSLGTGHVLSQSDVLDLRASWREAVESQEAVARAEAESGQCAVAARVFKVVHNEGQLVDAPGFEGVRLHPGNGADTIDADFEEA